MQQGDQAEEEADRIAAHVLRMPEPQSPCGCGCDGTCPKGEIEQPNLENKGLQKKRIQVGDTGQIGVPPVVRDVLRAPGQALDSESRQYMESRFGYDFSRVRVHAGRQAKTATQAVNALAFTVGADVVLNALHIDLRSLERRRLLAHELTHVVQQAQGVHRLQCWADCKPARLAPSEDCPPRREGEVQNARRGPMIFQVLNVAGTGQGGLIADFDIGSATIKSNLHGTIYWKKFLEDMVAERSRWNLLGFTDCQGADSVNQKLRQERVDAVFGLLPPEAKSQIVSRGPAASYECVTENNDPRERTLNRSVAFILESSSLDVEPETLDISPPHLEPNTESCSRNQKDRLAVAFPLGRRMIENALGVIDAMEKGSKEEVLLRKYFGKDAFAQRLRIKRGYTDTLREWKGGPSWPYVCVKQGVGDCDYHPLTYGYVESFGLPGWAWGPKADIHICEAAFELNNIQLAAVVIHETSHRLDWTTTDVYCDMLANQGCFLDTKKAIDNADSYAQFARESFILWG